MPLLREEAEKLSNNELEQGVIETIIDRDDLFAILPFMKINSKAYLYNREKTLSEATFIDVNRLDSISSGFFGGIVSKITSFIITALLLGLAAYGVKNGLQ